MRFDRNLPAMDRLLLAVPCWRHDVPVGVTCWPLWDTRAVCRHRIETALGGGS